MEDPWGSPWAVADSPASPPKIDLPAAPPSVHFPIENGNTTTGIAAAGSSTNSPRRSIQSPWGLDNDDDNVWGGWNDGSTAAPAAAGSPAWGRSSPGLMPIAPSLSSRGASPDPWRLSGEDRRRSSSVNKRSALGDGERIGDSGISLGPGGLMVGRLERKPSSESGFGAQDDTWTGLGQATAAPTAGEIKPLPLLITTPADEPVPPKKTSKIETGFNDDEPRPADTTQTPSKVQELVDHYDGIAKLGMSPVSPSSNEPPPLRKVSRGGKPLEDSSTGIESEDANETEESPTADKDDVVSPSTTEHEDADTQVEGATEFVGPEEPLESHVTQAHLSQKPKTTPIDVSIDLSKLDDLFPSTPEPRTEPELVPDVIIDDSFTSISERKVWYRLSRKGSKLMHSGDLESYVRMDWTRSTVRQDTLKTVRRWMEEDSMTGRPSIGRKMGVVGPSVFNWNSAAPAVEIGELLRKKPEHSRHLSSVSKGSVTSPGLASFEWASPPTSPATDTGVLPLSLAGKFKSSVSRPTRPQSLAAQSTSTFARDNPDSPYAETDKLPRPNSLIAPPPELIVQPSISPALSPPPPSNGLGIQGPKGKTDDSDSDDDDDDDDDWGEMVMSPKSETASAKVPLTPTGPVRRESIKPASPTDKSSGFEVQGLQGGPELLVHETSPPSTHQKTTSDAQIVTDSWNLDGVETLSNGQEVAQGKAPLQETGPASSDHEPVASPTIKFPTYHNGLMETATKGEPSKFSWFDALMEAAVTPELPPTPSPSNSFDPVPESQSPEQTSPSHIVSGEDVDEELVSRILRGIPDLSYMLR